MRFSIESDSKNSFSRSRCIGSEPGIHENLAELERSTIRNELSVFQCERQKCYYSMVRKTNPGFLAAFGESEFV